jgi:hypothetical protein
MAREPHARKRRRAVGGSLTAHPIRPRVDRGFACLVRAAPGERTGDPEDRDGNDGRVPNGSQRYLHVLICSALSAAEPICGEFPRFPVPTLLERPLVSDAFSVVDLHAVNCPVPGFFHVTMNAHGEDVGPL